MCLLINHKYGPLIEGRQYCRQCGKVSKCHHIWIFKENVSTFSDEYHEPIDIHSIYECKFCGKINRKKI